MGGSVRRADGTLWTHTFWVFHRLMDTMAEATRDADLEAHLREIEDDDPGHLIPGTDRDTWESHRRIVAASVSDDR